MKRITTPRMLAAILTLSLGFAAGGSLAAPGHGEGHGRGVGNGAPHAHAIAPMFHPRALVRLHDELKLDEKQDALWKEAQSFSREHHEAMRSRWQKDQAEIKALLDQPGSDLRAVVKRMDELRAEGLEQRDVVRDRWFAIYDSLGDGQKEKVRLFFKENLERKGHAERAREGQGRGHPGHKARPAQ